ncbi:MAG: IS3 family transposase [Bacteroidales bacterium]|nr:IS3 family transposase [Bacteroidales bacterium]
MNKLYKSLGISKQAFHQRMDRMYRLRSEKKQLLLFIHQIRKNHPTMGARDMYFKLQPHSMGRDVFEDFCREEGLMSRRVKNWRRTTDSTGVVRFENLLKDMTLTDINQAWQSDITYFEISGSFYYITFIEDSFSRRIIGHSVAKRLTTEQTTLPALKMAVKLRMKENTNIAGVVFHSDGGGQYYDKAFLKPTQKEGIINSMCEHPWDNGKVERLNGVIKNNYLIHRDINSFEELKKEVDRTVLLYNKEKPHIELQRKSPIQFEKDYLCNGQQSDGDKSTTELKTQNPEDFSALRAEDNNPSGSNITHELTTQKMKISK